MRVILDHYEINVAANGQHYARIVLPAGLTVEQAKNKMRVFACSMNVDAEQPVFAFTLYAHHAASRHEVEV